MIPKTYMTDQVWGEEQIQVQLGSLLLWFREFSLNLITQQEGLLSVSV